MVCCALQTQMSVWVCKHTHALARTEREREREVCSFSWLWAAAENFPSSPPLPAPTSCLHYSRVFFFFEATRMTARNRAGKWRRAWNTFDRSPSLPVAPPFFIGVLTVGTVSCDQQHVHSPFVHGAGSDRGEAEGGGVVVVVGRPGLAAPWEALLCFFFRKGGRWSQPASGKK